MTSKRWLIALLILSLVANGVLIGYLIGNFSRHEFRPPLLNPMLGTRHILSELAPARREALKPLLNQHLHDLRPNLREIRSAQSDMREAILAEPFDAAALSEALEHFQQRLRTSQAGGNSSFVAFVAALSPEERKVLVQRMDQTPRDRTPFSERRKRPHDEGDRE